MLTLRQKMSPLATVWSALQTGLPALLTVGLVLIVYLTTMAPSIFPLDSAELTVGAMNLSLVHSPGYPVYLLLAHGLTYLPIGEVAYRVNLLSALSSVGTIGLLLVLLRHLTDDRLAAVAATLSLAFSFYFWSLSLVAEVYTLQVFFLTLVLWGLWHWRQHGSQKALLCATLMAGIALANNLSTALWWLGFVWLALSTSHRQQLSASFLLKLAGIFVLGLLPVLYLPLVSATQPQIAFHGWYDSQGVFHLPDLTEPRQLLWYLSGGPFQGLVWAYSTQGFWRESIAFLHRLWAAFLGIGLPLGLWGLFKLWQKEHSLAIGLFLTALPHALFFIGYGAGDKETMFLPVYLIWALFMGVGLSYLRPILPKSLEAVKLVLPLALLFFNLSYVDVSDWMVPRQKAEARLQSTEPNAFYFAIWGDAAAMEYLQLTAQLRPDVSVINPIFMSPNAQQELVRYALTNERAVYSATCLPALASDYDCRPTHEGYSLQPKGRK